MLLVPRQLQRSNLTGDVPYYGGRFTPAQAWAAAHPTAPPLPSPGGTASGVGARTPLPTPAGQSTGEPVESGEPDGSSTSAALRHLRDSGVLSAEEYDELLTRTGR
jgi:hypothetical protein